MRPATSKIDFGRADSSCGVPPSKQYSLLKRATANTAAVGLPKQESDGFWEEARRSMLPETCPRLRHSPSRPLTAFSMIYTKCETASPTATESQIGSSLSGV